MYSKQFVFIIGIDAKKFQVHSSAIAQLSRPLHALINCGMKESVELYTVWEDVDEETFVAFAEFMYTGDYPDPEPDKLSFEDYSEKKVKSDHEFGRPKLPELSQLPMPPAALLNKFQSNKEYSVPGKPDPPPTVNDPWYQDFTPVFLIHAKVFELADRYDVQPLTRLSLNKLQRALSSFTLSKGGSNVIWNFLRHCYETPRPQRLRDLAAFYGAANIQHLWRDEEIRLLTKDCPELAADMLEFLMKV